ncbi:MAG: histidine phosphatase family protein [Rhodocyclaceae bacterium]|nr:histidine phosphatase family protein [Rhodocyclaceae bacterium]MCA3159444.1 histidine phosphatase family protein [Burkholderiales bacterium]MCA3593500.1 histidine phosphatase family protein [Methylocystis sp.]MCA3653781.1 histidine phosphatase family protein [Methylobacterium sp.]
MIDPRVPVPDWPLSEVGRARTEVFAAALAGRRIAAVYCSDERKARDGGEILARRFELEARVRPGLAEHDRASTGYIAPPEFWKVVAEFFARPDESIRGWAPARQAQAKIVEAVAAVHAESNDPGTILLVSHGGVGRLLRAHLEGVAIGEEDRPGHPGGGCYFPMDRRDLVPLANWRAVEDYPGHGPITHDGAA